jgi:hypothetical protein
VRWTQPSNAPEPNDLSPQRIRVTHPFHPLVGQEFEFVKRRKNWQVDRIYVYDASGKLASLPAEWTDAVAADPFVVVSAGRSPFHLANLAALTELIGDLTSDRSLIVKEITP